MHEAEVPGHLPARRTRRSMCCRARAAGGGRRSRPGARTRRAAAKALAANAAWSSTGRRRADGRRTHTARAEELQAGCRLACQTAVDGPMTRADSRRPRLLCRTASRSCVQTRDGGRAPDGDPVDLPSATSSCPLPARGDDAPDLLRLERAIGPFQVDLALLRELAGRLARPRFPRHGRAWPRAGCWTSSRAIPSGDAFAVAFDIGTTTLGGRALGRRHRPRIGRRLAAQSADPLRRRRALAHPARPQIGPTGCGNCRKPSSRPSTK